MEGVLESAVVLCSCKLACSLLFLPSLAASYSPVSFCCCCLLIFTDFLVTGFLSLLCVFKSWLTDLSPPGDVIALRFLLFLSHTYGAVLLLTTFLIALDSLIRLLWPHLSVNRWTESQTVGVDGWGRYVLDGDAKEAKEDDGSLHQVVGFFCCLSVWFIAALSVSWHWKMEETWAAVCLHTTNSLVRCLPNALSPLPTNLCWGILFLFVILVTMNRCLQKRCQVPAQTQRASDKNPCSCCRLNLLPALSAPLRPVHPGTSVAEPEETESSCVGSSAHSCKSMQMLMRHHGHFVLVSICSSEKRSTREHERTKKDVPLTFIREEHADSHHMCGWPLWGFPSPEENLLMGLVSVLSIFMLPFNLSVNILLIRTIDFVLDRCVRSLQSSAATIRDTATCHSVMQV